MGTATPVSLAPRDEFTVIRISSIVPGHVRPAPGPLQPIDSTAWGLVCSSDIELFDGVAEPIISDMVAVCEAAAAAFARLIKAAKQKP